MTLADWIRQTAENVGTDGIDGLEESLYELRVGALRRTERFAEPGTNVFERDWDVLCVLDGCRVDAMEEVAGEYGFLGSAGTLRSVGSTSYQWMERTFTGEYADELARTAHVTANPFTAEYADAGDFAVLDEVWRDGWDDEVGIVPARAVTDRAIRLARDRGEEFDRLLVHYMQPHFPSVPEPLGSGSRLPEWRDGREMAWQGLRRGRFAEEEVWAAYVANLRYVLDDVALLRRNLDADRLVLTADHGNARGEFGIYGHPDVPLRVLRSVPWYETTATDEGTYQPGGGTDRSDATEATDGPGSADPSESVAPADPAGASDPATVSVEDRLRALGYRGDG